MEVNNETELDIRAQALKAWREQVGINRKQMATYIGVSKVAYGDWELGKYKPSKQSKMKLISSDICVWDDYLFTILTPERIEEVRDMFTPFQEPEKKRNIFPYISIAVLVAGLASACLVILSQ